MTNRIYQAAIEHLEEVLPPRVVSRSLKEGLQQQGKSPDTVGLEDFEEILKSSVYRHLQVSMPADQARQTVTDILERLRAAQEGTADADGEGASPPAASDDHDAVAEGVRTEALARQEEELAALHAALKPFNLYFEWPEVQKLRAQVQLLEEEQRKGRDAPGLVEEAHRQLEAVRQKLEDNLVIQARELAELEEAFEAVQNLGGPKVRRLENLVGQIRQAQSSRQLAPAELERARKISNDLRKQVESSPNAQEGPAATVDAGEATSDAEITQRLRQLDREAERHELDRLVKEHANLLGHLPELATRIDERRALLEDGGSGSVAADIADIRRTLAEAGETQRAALSEEFAAIAGEIAALPEEVDTAELAQALAVARGVLETTLPSERDTDHIRRMHRLALEKAEELSRFRAEAEAQRHARLEEQRELVARARAALERYRESGAGREPYEALAASVGELASATDEGRIAPELAAGVRSAEEALEAAIAEHADDARLRRRARLRALVANVDGLPGLDALAARIAGVRRELSRLLEASEEGDVSPVQLDAVESLVEALRRDAVQTCRTRLDQLAQRASTVGDDELLGMIQTANKALDDDVYPDIRTLEHTLRQSAEAHRKAQDAELRRLERDAAGYLDSGLEDALALDRFLEQARARLAEGEPVDDMARGWERLESLREQVDARLAEFGPRLDAALDRFKAVSMLNSEDVASARRILKHLDSQRDAFPRVSVGLRIQLERGLTEAETLLDRLAEEAEATRAIADRLMSANVLDDVLGIFGGAPEAAADEPEDDAPNGTTS